MKLQSQQECPTLTRAILGLHIDRKPSSDVVGIEGLKYLRKPNEDQLEAINLTLSNELTLVSGPPGTCKTELIAMIAFAFLSNNPTSKVLAVAPSNVAVDELALRINSYSLSVARLFSKSFDSSLSVAGHLSIEELMFKIDPSLKDLSRKHDNGELNSVQDLKFM